MIREIPFSSLEIHIYKSGVYIVNYKEITSFSDNLIKIGNISIVGSNLVISSLKKNEIYITGNIYEVKLK